MNVVKVNLMYRDASNYKNHGEDYFKNAQGLTLEEIEEFFSPVLDEPEIVQYYGIKSIAPVESEFDLSSGDDHAYCEITGVEIVEDMSATNLRDIVEVVEAIAAGGNANLRQEMLSNTIEKYETHLDELKGKL